MSDYLRALKLALSGFSVLDFNSDFNLSFVYVVIWRELQRKWRCKRLIRDKTETAIVGDIIVHWSIKIKEPALRE